MTFDTNLSFHLDLGEKEEVTIDRSTLLVAGGTYNGVYFPEEELKKMYKSFEGKPINLNHSHERVEDIVGYLEDVRFEDGKITANPIFDEATSRYKEAVGYIETRFNAGRTPNVSIGAWLDIFEEKNDKDEVRLVARNGEADHLALVVHGACSPQDGCGIAMEDNTEVTVPDEEYAAKSELYDNLQKEILKEQIKFEKEEKNV